MEWAGQATWATPQPRQKQLNCGTRKRHLSNLFYNNFSPRVSNILPCNIFLYLVILSIKAPFLGFPYFEMKATVSCPVMDTTGRTHVPIAANEQENCFHIPFSVLYTINSANPSISYCVFQTLGNFSC